MSIADELLKLDELRRSGALTDQEFEIAKKKALEASSEFVNNTDHLKEIKSQNEIAQLDRKWEIDREKYMGYGKRGRRFIPNKTSSLISGIFVVGFGAVWITMAISITRGIVMPLFGVLFVIFGVATSFSHCIKAGKYQEALEEYEQRRSELLGNDDLSNHRRGF